MSNQMFPRYTILYKIDDTPGWNYAIMGCNEIECKKECERLKIKNNWFSYKCYYSSSCVIKREIPFQKVTPSAYDIQLTTDLIYLPYADKWFYPDEIIPYPQENKTISKNLDVEVRYDEDDNDCCYDTNDVEFTFVEILFTTSAQKVELYSYAEDFLNAIPIFIKDLNKNNYANLSMEELTATKFLAWKINDDIRFMIQLYVDEKVQVSIDTLIDKKAFENTLQKFQDYLKHFIKVNKENYGKK